MKNRVLLLLLSFLLSFGTHSVSMTSAAFSDVSFSHANKAAIEYVQSKGIVSGYPDGTYQPERLLNRAEFTKIIVESRFKKIEIENCVATEGFYKKKIFSDVENGVWFEKYICVAKKNNIIGGYPDGTFKPIQSINFAEAAKIVTSSYGLEVSAGEPWFTPFLNKLASLEAIPVSVSGLETEIQRALKEVTRGEMAEVIFRMRNQNDTVVSPDGSFSIKIPETALPEGVDFSSIKIRKLELSEAPVKEIYGAPMVFYRLEPDGIQFRELVTFSVSTPTSKNTIPMVFLVSGDSFDMIPEPLIEIDQTEQKASISGQLAHFSDVGIGDLPLFSLSVNRVQDQTVGNTFSRTASIMKNQTPNTFVNIIDTTSVMVLDDWSIGSGIFQNLRGDISPLQIFDAPGFHLFTGPQLYSTTQYFQCQSAGEAVSKYTFSLEFTYVRKYADVSNINSASIMVTEVGNTFNCLP